MESIDLSPQNGFFNSIASLSQRVKSIETRPAGEIVIRESITTSDEATGVDTIFGLLPDGSMGFLPWVNDITPPERPSTPSLISVTGIFTIEWDGLDYLGRTQPLDYQKTAVQISSDGLTGWTTRDFLRQKGLTVISGEPYSAVRYFRLISYDQNNNASVPSNIVYTLNTTDFDDSGLNDRLDEVQQKADAASQAAAVADAAAGTAQAAADAAAALAAGKGKVLIRDTPPGADDRNENTLWIDTTGGANTPKKWVYGETWEAVTDKAIIDAAAAAVIAQDKADAAFDAAEIALTAAGNAQSSANGKNNVYYMDTLPSGSGFVVGDTVFIRLEVGQPIIGQFEWDGSTWKPVTIGHQVIASIDLGKGTFGELDGVHIKARSMLVSSLLIGSFDNMLTEPEFNGGLKSWGGAVDGYSVDPSGSRNGTTALQIENTPTQQGRYNTSTFSVEEGSAYRLSAWVKCTVDIPLNGIALYFRSTLLNNTTSASSAFGVAATPANTWVKISGLYTIPAGRIAGTVGIFSQASMGTGTILVDSISCVRASDGSLFVDGSIDGKTITGALFQTAATGARIVIDGRGTTNSINAYDSTGKNYFSVTPTAGVVMMGDVSSIGKYGTKTITARLGDTVVDDLTTGAVSRNVGLGFTVAGGTSIGAGIYFDGAQLVTTSGGKYTDATASYLALNKTKASMLHADVGLEISSNGPMSFNPGGILVVNGDIDTYRVIGLQAPTKADEATNKSYVDNKNWAGTDIVSGLINPLRIANATASIDGLMSKADKVSMDKLPYAMASGKFNTIALQPNAQQQVTVTYPSGRFTATPALVATPTNSRLSIGIAEYAASATVTITNTYTFAIAASSVSWIAIQN